MANPRGNKYYLKHPDPEDRQRIANEYRRARRLGLIEDRDAWLYARYGISRALAQRYMKEFPEEPKQERETDGYSKPVQIQTVFDFQREKLRGVKIA